MPPKPKFSKEKITKTAYKIIKKEGINSLTARSIASKLESSARPIFTVFENMEDLKNSVREKVLKEFLHFIKVIENENSYLVNMAIRTVRYAIIEPELFKVLFSWGADSGSKNGLSVCNMKGIENTYIEAISKEYGIEYFESKIFFEKIWINIFGMATLVMGKTIRLSEQEIELKILQDINNIFSSLELDRRIELDYEEEAAATWNDSDEISIIEQEKEEKPVEKKENERIFSWLD